MYVLAMSRNNTHTAFSFSHSPRAEIYEAATNITPLCI